MLHQFNSRRPVIVPDFSHYHLRRMSQREKLAYKVAFKFMLAVWLIVTAASIVFFGLHPKTKATPETNFHLTR